GGPPEPEIPSALGGYGKWIIRFYKSQRKGSDAPLVKMQGAPWIARYNKKVFLKGDEESSENGPALLDFDNRMSGKVQLEQTTNERSRETLDSKHCAVFLSWKQQIAYLVETRFRQLWRTFLRSNPWPLYEDAASEIYTKDGRERLKRAAEFKDIGAAITQHSQELCLDVLWSMFLIKQQYFSLRIERERAAARQAKKDAEARGTRNDGSAELTPPPEMSFLEEEDEEYADLLRAVEREYRMDDDGDDIGEEYGASPSCVPRSCKPRAPHPDSLADAETSSSDSRPSEDSELPEDSSRGESLGPELYSTRHARMFRNATRIAAKLSAPSVVSSC
ncbi:unnamed protein product, partial [Amoebophrya sp. A25]